MKKLMLAAAVAALSTVGFSDVVSSSVVGYQNKSLTGGLRYDFCVSTFKAVGKEIRSMTLGDISASASWQAGTDELKTLTLGGGILAAYTYVNATEASEWGCEQGWYLTSDVNDDEADLSVLCKNSVTLPMTQGVLLSVSDSSTTIVYAGEVLDEDQPISLTGGLRYDFTGNISPTDITLGDVTASATWQAGTDELKTLTLGGGILEAYTYVNSSEAAEWGCTPGWYLTSDVNDDEADLSTLNKNSVSLPAGQAVLVSVSSSATTITIPAAL